MAVTAERTGGVGGLWVALVVAAAVTACVGPAGGVGEGDVCSQDDCAQDLTCQPIPGRPQDYCCPTPASMSSKPNCQPAEPSGGDGG